MKEKYSLVVPCYNEQGVVSIFYDKAIPVMESLNEPFEIVFINDGSRDNTLLEMQGLAEKDKRVKVINFSRNFGQQAAIFCGFEYAKGDAVICIDADLQDPIEAVPQMIEKWKSGFEIVHGRRLKRKGESLFKKITSKMYLKFLRRISGLDIPQNVGEFKLFDRKVIDTINSMPEHNRYLRGVTSWVGYKQTFVEFERNERKAGKTHYSFKQMVKLAFSGIISYSMWPLKLAIRLGILVGFLSAAAFITFAVLICCGISLPLTVWIFPTVTLCTSLICVMIGVNNIYFNRLYENIQNRPRFIVADTVNIND